MLDQHGAFDGIASGADSTVTCDHIRRVVRQYLATEIDGHSFLAHFAALGVPVYYHGAPGALDLYRAIDRSIADVYDRRLPIQEHYRQLRRLIGMEATAPDR